MFTGGATVNAMLERAPVLITVLRQPSGPPWEDGGRLQGLGFTCQYAAHKVRFVWRENIWSLSLEHRPHWKTLSFAFSTTVLIDLFGLGASCMLCTGVLTYWDPGPFVWNAFKLRTELKKRCLSEHTVGRGLLATASLCLNCWARRWARNGEVFCFLVFFFL